MATIAQPQPSIFTSDPMEQLFGRGVMDPRISGLSYMFMDAMGAKRDRQSDRYLAANAEANRMAVAMDRYEQNAKLAAERAKIAGGLVKEGFSPGEVAGGTEIATDNNVMTGLLQELARSNIFKNRQAGAGGGGGGIVKPETVVTSNIFPDGSPALTTIRSKASDPGAAHTANSAAVASVYRDMKVNPQKYTPLQKQMMQELLMKQSGATNPGIVDQ